MPEYKLPEEEKRQAVIVGINYEKKDSTFPKLTGAVNDAKEIYKRLKDPHIGNFEVSNDHYLTEKKATCKAIRKAISDVFWKTDGCDKALFYFAGHGFVDGYGDGYIVPYDMSMYEPFVCGINMRDLTQVISKSVNDCNIIILDCCYSGIATEGDRSTLDFKTKFEEHVEKLSVEGTITITSSEADQVSREITPEPENGQEQEPHGAFTFCLIKGLDGQASDDEEKGIITLSKLHEYVEQQLPTMGKQQVKFSAADSSGMSAIIIAIAPEVYKKYIREKIEEFKKFCYKESPLDLMYAVDTIAEVLRVAPKIPEALAHKEELDKEIVNVERSIGNWWDENGYNVRKEIKRQSATPETPKVFTVLDHITIDLSFKKIKALDERKKTLFEYLCKVSRKDIDTDIGLFIKKCQRYDNLPSTQEPTTGPSSEKRYDNPPSIQKPTIVPSNERDIAT